MAARLDDFAPLRPAEQRLVEWLQAGNREDFEVSPGLPPEDAPGEVRLRASFVRYLALGGCDVCRTTEKGLRVQGAFIEGDGPEGAETRGLDLEGCRLPGDLALFACRFPDLVLMRGAEVRSLFLNSSVLGSGLVAERLEAKGDVLLCDVAATSEVRLSCAKLGGNLDATGATFTEVGEGFAFGADGLEAKGFVFLSGVTATGEIRLVGAKLGGGLDASDSIFAAVGTGNAFIADRLEASAVFMRGVTATGEVRLLGANLCSDLGATGAEFNSTGEGSAFAVDGLRTTGAVFLTGVTAKGEVRLRGAKIGGVLVCEGTRLTAGKRGKALNCNGMRLGGSFFLRQDTRIDGVLDLTGAEIGHVNDDPACWPQRKGDLLLNRCRYGAFLGRSPVDAASRIRWLSLQEVDVFHPQPWEECARVLREMGHGTAAREILIEKEKRQRAARRAAVFRSSLNLGPLYAWTYGLWDGVLGATVRYGRQPLLAFAWLFGFWALGAVIFASADGQGALKPNLPQIQRAPEWVLCGVTKGEAADLPSVPGEARGLREGTETQYACYLRQPEARAYPAFNALVYSADTLLPVVSLEMQAYWLPDEDVAPGGWVRAYLWLHIAAGWALSLLAVAGFSGLIRTDNTK